METKCPICGKKVQFNPEINKNRSALPEEFPFCSHRCKLLDLGAWLNAEYRIPVNSDKPGEEQNENMDNTTENP